MQKHNQHMLTKTLPLPSTKMPNDLPALVLNYTLLCGKICHAVPVAKIFLPKTSPHPNFQENHNLLGEALHASTKNKSRKNNEQESKEASNQKSKGFEWINS